jgi:hypothetical protein
MAAEHRSQAGLLAAWHAAAVVATIPFNEVRIDPNADNPFKEPVPEDEGLARAKAFIAKRAWRATVAAARGSRN